MADTFKGIITADGKKRTFAREGITPEYVSDKTLSVDGGFADAKVTGDAVKSLKEDLISKADKTSLVKTDRKLDALWKLNQGISYEFQADDAEAYQKTVPSGAKVANVKSIGGKTIVWNQLVEHIESHIKNNVSINVDEKGTFVLNGTSSATIYLKLNNEKKSIIGHKYYISQKRYPVNSDTYIYNDGGGIALLKAESAIQTAALEKTFYLRCDSDTTFDNVVLKPIIVDLTQMFGSGNEPSTPEEFEAMFPADYYPYNAGELMSASVNEVKVCGKNLWSGQNTENYWMGNNVTENTECVSSDYIPIKGSQTIYAGFSYDWFVGFNCYDLKKNKILGSEQQINSTQENIENEYKIVPSKVKTPENTAFIKMMFSRHESKPYVSIVDGKYELYHEQTVTIPQAILNLPGYGWSAGNVRNEVNWENKQYHKRVGKVDLGTLEYRYDTNNIRFIAGLADVLTKEKNDKINCISTFYTATSGDIFDNSKETDLIIRVDENANQIYIRNLSYADATTFKNAMSGIILYYELAEEQITDISNLIGDTLQEPIEVEAGGTLTFKNSNGDNYRIPVSSSEEYLVSLAEVAK